MKINIEVDGEITEFTDDQIVEEFDWHNIRNSNHCLRVRRKIFKAMYDELKNEGKRRVQEDWRIDPCRCCNSLAMLWWRFCPFCGTQLPTVLDGKVVDE